MMVIGQSWSLLVQISLDLYQQAKIWSQCAVSFYVNIPKGGNNKIFTICFKTKKCMPRVFVVGKLCYKMPPFLVFTAPAPPAPGILLCPCSCSCSWDPDMPLLLLLLLASTSCRAAVGFARYVKDLARG